MDGFQEEDLNIYLSLLPSTFRECDKNLVSDSFVLFLKQHLTTDTDSLQSQLHTQGENQQLITGSPWQA